MLFDLVYPKLKQKNRRCFTEKIVKTNNLFEFRSGFSKTFTFLSSFRFRRHTLKFHINVTAWHHHMESDRFFNNTEPYVIAFLLLTCSCEK